MIGQLLSFWSAIAIVVVAVSAAAAAAVPSTATVFVVVVVVVFVVVIVVVLNLPSILTILFAPFFTTGAKKAPGGMRRPRRQGCQDGAELGELLRQPIRCHIGSQLRPVARASDGRDLWHELQYRLHIGLTRVVYDEQLTTSISLIRPSVRSPRDDLLRTDLDAAYSVIIVDTKPNKDEKDKTTHLLDPVLCLCIERSRYADPVR